MISLKILRRIFTELAALMRFGTKMTASDFVFRRSKFKVTVELSMQETALCRWRQTVLDVSR